MILSEPVENLTSGGSSPVGRLLRPFTNPGVGNYRFRYDLESFRIFAEREGANEIEFEPGWRNAIAIF